MVSPPREKTPGSVRDSELGVSLPQLQLPQVQQKHILPLTLSAQAGEASQSTKQSLALPAKPFAALSRAVKALLRFPIPNLPSSSSSASDKVEPRLVSSKNTKTSASGSPSPKQESEERALAQALAAGRRATLLAFYSPHCRLCRSLAPAIDEVKQKEAPWLNVVSLNATAPGWLPEVSYYSIAYVPCFVLLDGRGRAMAKTGEPYSRRHVMKGLAYLLESLRPIRKLAVK